MSIIKNLPDNYHHAINILDALKKRLCSIKDYLNKLDSSKHNIKAIYALVSNVTNNHQDIKRLASICMKNNSNLNPNLLEIILGKIKFEKKYLKRSLPKCKEVEVVLNSLPLLNIPAKIRINKKNLSELELLRVRYLRVNFISAKLDEIINELIANHFILVKLPEKSTFNDFIERSKALKQHEFMVDYHFYDELIVINQLSIKYVTRLPMYAKRKLIFQDKASVLAIEAMDMTRKMTILDACAAPGTKTLAMASRCKNKVKITAVDISKDRIKEMHKLLNESNVTCVDIIEDDFSKLNPEDFPNVDILLLDPTCTGSGMLGRKPVKERQRSCKLASLQTLLLKHAFKFKPKRIVYSTCSLDILENENVIKSAMSESPDSTNYTLINALPSWPMRGKGNYPFASFCLRSNESLLTKGFFVAVLERINDSKTCLK